MVTMGGLWTRALLQMLSTVVLARLLTPADFGLIAMVASIMGVAELVRDFGMTGAIIQARDMSERLWRSVMWLSMGIGIVLAGALALCAPLVALLYNEPKLVQITLFMAPGLFISGLAMPLQARATKELRFVTLAALDAASMAAGVVAGIVTALMGWGFWSLVAMAAANFLVRLVVLWIVVKPKFGPPKIVKETWSLVSTGGSIFGAELLGYAEKNLDNVIIGAQLGPAALGQYSRGYALFLLPLQQMNGPLGRVALPVLSALRDDGDRYRRYIRSAALVIGYLTLPTYAIAAGVAQPLVLLLLGPGWEMAATIFALLSIAGFAQAIGRLRTWLYISLGRSHRQFVYDLVARPIVIAGFFFGIWWGGIYGLVLTYGALSILLLIPGFAFAMRGTFMRGRDVYGPLIRPLIMAVLAFGASYGMSHLIPTPIAILEVLIGGVSALLVVLPLLLIPGYRRDLLRLVDFVKQMRRAPKKGASETPAAVADDIVDDGDISGALGLRTTAEPTRIGEDIAFAHEGAATTPTDSSPSPPSGADAPLTRRETALRRRQGTPAGDADGSPPR
jgi:O-antigen/teichoic acid export membrane protein